MSRISQTLLYRLAARALRVYERHEGLQPAHSAFAGRLPAAAEDFRTAYCRSAA